jgi:hypothetical protein
MQLRFDCNETGSWIFHGSQAIMEILYFMPLAAQMPFMPSVI